MLPHLAAEADRLPRVGITDEDQNRSLHLVRADTVRIEGDASHKRLCSLTGSERWWGQAKSRQDGPAPMRPARQHDPARVDLGPLTEPRLGGIGIHSSVERRKVTRTAAHRR